MSENIVILSGSPRRNGNTDKLVTAFVDGAETAGKSVTLFHVADMKIGGCLGCGHCFEEKGVCVQKDDMPQILLALRKADALVLATPIYFFSVAAQLKLAIDRTYALMNDKAPIKKAALLMTCGNGGMRAAEGAINIFKNMCLFSKWEEAGMILAQGLHAPDAIEGHEELEQAKSLGREI